MPLRKQKFRLSDVSPERQQIARDVLSQMFSTRLTNLQSQEISTGERVRRLEENPRVGKYHYRQYSQRYGKRTELEGIGYRGPQMLREARSQYAGFPAKIGQARLNLRSVETMENPLQELMNISGGRGRFKRKWNEMFPGG